MPLKDREKRREYHKEYMRRWYVKNKSKHIAYVRNRDKKIKDWFKDYKKSLQCEDCGENHPACLDFHHVNPKEKSFALGRANKFLSVKLLENEIAKCRLLCSNCHRKEHYRQKEKERLDALQIHKIVVAEE